MLICDEKKNKYNNFKDMKLRDGNFFELKKILFLQTKMFFVKWKENIQK